MGRLLVVDDDARLLRAYELLLGGEGHDLTLESSVEAALTRVESWRPEVVLMDVHLPGMGGLEGVRLLRERLGPVPIIVMTGEGSMGIAIEASRLGAWEYCLKPVDPDLLLQLVDRALAVGGALRSAAAETRTLHAEPAADAMEGQGARMQEVYRAIGRAAATDATVLIRGESGTGKELVARAIHRFGIGTRGPLVAVNCVAIPETLLESMLFGHEKGAFTGAVNRQVGRLEQANGGTLFLDEVGDLPAGLQGKILRVLQERTYERVGGGETLSLDARIITATHRDIEKAMKSGAFREDLYHRLNVVTIQLPALREHKEDIPQLVRSFLKRFSHQMGYDVSALPAEAMRLLEAYDWPGNVRELEHCIKRALVHSRGFPLTEEDIRHSLQVSGSNRPALADAPETLEPFLRAFLAAHGGDGAYHRLLDEVESLLLKEALRQSGGKQSVAARLLGLPRPTLHARLNRHGIRPGAAAESTPEPGTENGSGS